MKLRAQISLLLTTLIILAISATAGILIYQSRQDISAEIYTNARNYAELTSERMVTVANEYLPSQSFVIFNPIMTDLLRKNNDVSFIKIYKFNGDLLYDSREEATEQYTGPVRQDLAREPNYETRIQNQRPSVQTDSGLYYLNKKDNGTYTYVNKEGSALAVSPDWRIEQARDFVFPVNNEYAVVFNVSYQNLIDRLEAAAINIAIVAAGAILFSILIGLLFAGTLTRPLQKLTKTVSLIAKGDLDQQVKIKSKGEVGLLATAVNQMVVDLKKSIEARIFKEKTEKEIELAAKIQQALLPKTIPDVPGMDIAAKLIPASKVSGDVYDVLEVNNELGHYVYCYLGDVTGHGISASLLSTSANAMIAMLAPQEPDPVTLLAKVNTVLKRKTSGTVFITLALIKYDITNNQLSYVNAGHEQLLRFDSEAKSIVTEEPGGIALGMLPDIKEQLEQRKIDLKKGESIIIYSDGLPEAWKNETDTFTMDSLIASYNKNANMQTADAITKAIFKDVNDFRSGFEQKDDMTLVVFKRP